MAKRIKHVFDTSEVAHIWAAQTQTDGRNQRNNLYFDGPTIYSYGHHFPIARFIYPPDSRIKLILINGV